MYKIGTYKNGQQIAKEVFASNNLAEIKAEFKKMFDATIEEEWGNDWEPGTVENITFEVAWEYKHFSEDVNNVSVFEVENEESLHTNYTYQGCTSKMM